MYGQTDACTNATAAVFTVTDRYNNGFSVSFSEADMAFEEFCTISGCTDRLIEFIRSCDDPVSVNYCYVNLYTC